MQITVSHHVSLQVTIESVLPTVHFNNQFCTPTFEIDDVGGNGGLTAKVMAKLPQSAKVYPQLHFLTGHPLA